MKKIKTNKTSHLNLLNENRVIFKLPEAARNLEAGDTIAHQEIKDQDTVKNGIEQLREDIFEAIENERDSETEIDAETEKSIDNSIEDLIMNIAHYIANYEAQGPSGKKLILNNIRTETLLFFAKNNNSYAYKLARDHKQVAIEAIDYQLKDNLIGINPETLKIAKETLLETLGFIN